MRPCTTLPSPAFTQVACAPTRETGKTRTRHSAYVSTSSEWPQRQFLAWLDELKERLDVPSDYQLAQRLGIGHTLISGWRNGRQRPSIGTLTAIATATGDDARRLWVLAGAVPADNVGLSQQPAPEPLPREIEDLIALYHRSDRDTRTVLLGQVKFLVDAITPRARKAR